MRFFFVFLTIIYFQSVLSASDGQAAIDRFMNGDMSAGAKVGMMYAIGSDGAERDCQKAGFFLAFCAKKGERSCMKAIGDLYAKGICVGRNKQKANYFYQLSKQKLHGNVDFDVIKQKGNAK